MPTCGTCRTSGREHSRPVYYARGRVEASAFVKRGVGMPSIDSRNLGIRENERDASVEIDEVDVVRLVDRLLSTSLTYPDGRSISTTRTDIRATRAAILPEIQRRVRAAMDRHPTADMHGVVNAAFVGATMRYRYQKESALRRRRANAALQPRRSGHRPRTRSRSGRLTLRRATGSRRVTTAARATAPPSDGGDGPPEPPSAPFRAARRYPPGLTSRAPSAAGRPCAQNGGLSATSFAPHDGVAPVTVIVVARVGRPLRLRLGSGGERCTPARSTDRHASRTWAAVRASVPRYESPGPSPRGTP